MAGRTAVHVAQQVLLIVNPLVEVPLQVFVRLWRQQHSAAELQTAAVLALLAALLAAALAALLARPRRPPARESPTDEAHAGESCEWLNAWLQARRLRVPEDQLKAQLATALARQLQPQDPQQQQQPQQAEQTPAQEAQPQPQAARRGSNFEVQSTIGADALMFFFFVPSLQDLVIGLTLSRNMLASVVLVLLAPAGAGAARQLADSLGYLSGGCGRGSGAGVHPQLSSPAGGPAHPPAVSQRQRSHCFGHHQELYCHGQGGF